MSYLYETILKLLIKSRELNPSKVILYQIYTIHVKKHYQQIEKTFSYLNLFKFYYIQSNV